MTNEDCFWKHNSKDWRYSEYRVLAQALEEFGLHALYGGTKGHGFWVEGWKKSEPGDTGNCSFFSMREALLLLPRSFPALADGAGI